MSMAKEVHFITFVVCTVSDSHLVAAFKELGVGNWVIQVGAEKVSSQSFRRLIGHLHTCIRTSGEHGERKDEML